MDLSGLARSIHARLDAKNAAREQALPAARRSIRASANAIRAIHRSEFDTAKTLIGESRASLDEGLAWTVAWYRRQRLDERGNA